MEQIEQHNGTHLIAKDVIPLSKLTKEPVNYFLQLSQTIHQNHCSQDLYPHKNLNWIDKKYNSNCLLSKTLNRTIIAYDKRE